MTTILQLKPPQTPPSYADLDLAWRRSCFAFLHACFGWADKRSLDALANEMYRARQASGVERG